MSPSSRDRHWISREFDARAAAYDRSAMHRWQADEAARLLDPKVGERILDLATGTGLGARACARRTSAPELILGIDLSHGMLRAAPTTPPITYLRADAGRLPFRGGVFDAVLCVAAVPYLPDLDGAVREWRRVARPGAGLVFTTPAADGSAALRLIRLVADAYGLGLPDPHAELGSTERIAARVDRLGLELHTVEKLSYPDPLTGDPEAAWHQVIDYGFADDLRHAPAPLVAAVLADYTSLYLRHRADGTGRHVVMFVRCGVR